MESIGEFYPKAKWQRCIVHFYRNVFSQAPRGKVAEVSRMLKPIHAQEDLAAARDKAHAVVEKLKKMKLKAAADLVAKNIYQTLKWDARKYLNMELLNHRDYREALAG